MPNCAADPRPNNVPYYIDNACPLCTAPLILADTVHHPDIEPDDMWHDEWVCSNCRNGIYFDVPELTLFHVFAIDDLELQPKQLGRENRYYER